MAKVSLWGAGYTDVPALVVPDGEGGTSTFYENGGGGGEVEPNDVTFIDYDGTVVASFSANEVIEAFENLSERITPVTYDYEPGWVAIGKWFNEDSTNNHTDVYAVQRGHTYICKLGSVVGNAFRSIILPMHPRDTTETTEGILITEKIGQYPNDEVAFTADIDGYYLVTKDHASTPGLQTYFYEVLDTSMFPENPSHSGLVAQGWNYTLGEIRDTLLRTGKCIVGQLYTTDNGFTKVYINLPEEWDVSTRQVYFRLRAIQQNDATIYWGDGSVELIAGNGIYSFRHTYAKPGKYVISVDPGEGGIEFYGSGSSETNGYSIYDSRNNSYKYRASYIYKVEIGDKVKQIGQSTFYFCWNLETISISKTLSSIGAYAFRGCYGLKALVSPCDFAVVGYMFYQCYSLKYVSLPFSSMSAFANDAFLYCYRLQAVAVPPFTSNIYSAAMQNCYVITKVVIPASVTNIAGQAFYQCWSLCEIRLKPTTPPSLANANALSNIAPDFKIYVPYSEDHSILDAYKTATNWSTYASHIVEEDAA